MEIRIALVTGASSGIGAVFARKLASQGYDLILVARRKAKLRQLAAELQTQFHVKAEVLVADLSHPSDLERVERRITELANLDLLVNDAGFGDQACSLKARRHIFNPSLTFMWSLARASAGQRCPG